MKQRHVILIALLAVLAATPFLEYRGMRIVGFRYGVFVNNSATVAPDTVVHLDGARITLADGRAFDVTGRDAEAIAAEMTYCNSRVRVTGEDLRTMRPVEYCGFDRPQRSQWLTIPLIRVDLPVYKERDFAWVSPAPPPTAHTSAARE